MGWRYIVVQIVRQAGVVASWRAYRRSRGSDLIGFCYALADDGWVIWYNCHTDKIVCEREAAPPGIVVLDTTP